jgi:hypothetical protein
MHVLNLRHLCLLIMLIGFPTSAALGVDPTTYAAPLGWTWGPSLPHITAGAACCATPQAVASIGGAYWEGLDTGAAKKIWINDVYRLAADGSRWESAPAYPATVSHALAVAVGDDVIVIGGRNAEQAFDAVWRLSLDEAAPAWQRGPSLPRAAFGLGGGVLGSTVYVVTDSYATIEGTHDAAHPPQVLAWDAADPNGGWTRIADVPDPEVGYRTVAVVGDRLVVMGGGMAEGDALQLVDAIHVLDLKTLVWSRGASLAMPLRDATAAALDDRRLVLVGGVEQAGAQTQGASAPAIILSNRCWIYDVETDRLEAAEPVPLAVADHGLAVAHDQLYVVAGEDSPYRTRTAQVQVAALPQGSAAITSARTTSGAHAP